MFFFSFGYVIIVSYFLCCDVFKMYITVLTVMCSTQNVLNSLFDFFSSLICSLAILDVRAAWQCTVLDELWWRVIITDTILSLVLEGDLKRMHAETPTPVTNHNQANVDRRPQKEKRAEIWVPGCPSQCLFCANVSSGNPMLTQLRIKSLPFSRYRNVPGHELDHRGNTQTCSSDS